MPSLNSPILSGDCSGGLHSTSVDKIKGSAVAATAPTVGQTLVWNGTAWAPASISTGGGGGANGLTYYLNQGTAPDAPTTNLAAFTKQLGRSAETTQSTATTGSLTPTTWTEFAAFVSEVTPQDPGTTDIPAGLWDVNCWLLGVADNNHTNQVRAKVYKYDGSAAPTLLATSAAVAIGTVAALVSITVLVPETAMTVTDRIYITLEAYATGNGHSVTGQFGGSTPSHVHTSLNLVAGTGLWKNTAGVLQSPASLLVDADVAADAAIAQSKIAGLTNALANVSAPGAYFEFFEHFMSTAGVVGNLSFGVTSGGTNTNVSAGYGSVQMSTGTTATAGAQSRLTQGQAILIGNSACRLIFRISQATATWFDATLTGVVRFGLASSATSESSNAIYFRATDSQAIQFCTRNANIETATTTGISFSNGVFRVFEISFDAAGTSVTAKIDGNVVATHTTNIPTGLMGILAQITRNSATGTAVAMNVDYIYNRVTPITPYF